MSALSSILAIVLLAAAEAPAAPSTAPVAESPQAEAVVAASTAAQSPLAEAVAAFLLGDWPAAEKRVSLYFDRTKTRDALSQLAESAGWSIGFKDRPHGKVDVRFTDVPADEALLAILQEHELVARRRANFVVIEDADEHEGAAAVGEEGSGRVNFGGSVQVAEGETVREAVSFGGDVHVDGTVLKDAVSFGGKVVLGPKAAVHGSVVSFGGGLEIDPKATVGKDRVSFGLAGIKVGGAAERAEPEEPEVSWFVEQISDFAGTVVRYALLFVLGLLLMAFVPTRLRVVSRELQRAPAACAAIGAVGAIALLPLTILLAVTVVGLVALPFVWLLVPVALLLGYTALAMFIGARFPSRNPRRSQVFALAIGVAVLFVVDLVPFLGALAIFALSMLVFGAVLRTRFGSGPQNDANFAPTP